MSSTRTYYCYCEDNCKFETMTKEQILTAIQQAVESHEITDVDTGFITKILEQNSNETVKIWVGTEAEFNALQSKATDTVYIYTTTFEEDITSEVNKIKDGTTVVPNATNATKVNNLAITRDANGVLKIGDTIIPQKILLSSTEQALTNDYTNIYSDTKAIAGRTFEIFFTNKPSIKITYTSDEQVITKVDSYTLSGGGGFDPTLDEHSTSYKSNGNALQAKHTYSPTTISKIYEIIE